MAASHDDKLDRYLPALWAVAGSGVGLTIRFTFGLPALKQALPYLIAGPAAYVLIRVTGIMWAAQKQQKTAHAKATNFVWMVILILWIVGTSSAGFQQWMDRHIFYLLVSIILFGVGTLLQFTINRLVTDRS
jgi:hypothetical protein